MSAAEQVTVKLPSGQNARYWRAGSGPTVLYLHSFVAPEGPDAFFEALAGRFDVVMPLAPGYADLDELLEIDDPHDLALFYDDLLRAIGVTGPLDVVGHSFGGMIAAELAAHFPDRFRRLALIAPYGLWSDDDPTADLARLPVPDLRWKLSTLEPPGDDDPGPGVEEVVALTRGMTAAVKFLWPFPDRGLNRRLHRVSAPTRIFWGRDDDINPPSYAERFATAIAEATVDLVPGGHLVVQDAPAEMAERVGGFLTGQATSS